MSRVLSLPRASRERQLGLLWGFVALELLGLSPFAPAMFGRLPPCIFHRATGLPCLTCGGTRAALALLGGDVGGALHANPLVTVFLLLVVVGGLAERRVRRPVESGRRGGGPGEADALFIRMNDLVIQSGVVIPITWRNIVHAAANSLNGIDFNGWDSIYGRIAYWYRQS